MLKWTNGLILVACFGYLEKAAVGAVVGVDGVHAFDATGVLATGSKYDSFRSTIVNMGNTIVSKTSFGPSDLAGLDALIIKMPHSQNSRPSFSPSEISAIQGFVHQRAVFVSDSSLWEDADAGGDRPITFGSNLQFLMNAVSYISQGGGVLFLAEGGSGFNVANFNDLVAPFGISYATTPTDPSGRSVSGFIPHFLTTGVSTVGVDFQLPMTVTSPSIDLTVGTGQDNIMAVLAPEPTCLSTLGLGLLVLIRHKRAPGVEQLQA